MPDAEDDEDVGTYEVADDVGRGHKVAHTGNGRHALHFPTHFREATQPRDAAAEIGGDACRSRGIMFGDVRAQTHEIPDSIF